MKTVYASITSAGERPVNEDSVGMLREGEEEYYFLCDGLGGHGGGDLASSLVVKTMQDCVGRNMTLEESAMQAQECLLQHQKQEKKENAMKTTLCALQIGQQTAHFLHVGDSRVYWFHKGKYRLRSLDHSVPQLLVKCGEIREKEIRHHPDRSRLLRVMGTPWDVPAYQVSDEIALQAGDTFLMCSDGFWEWITEKEMEKLLRHSSSPQEWLAAMEEQILRVGTGRDMDNYSAQAVFIQKDTHR